MPLILKCLLWSKIIHSSVRLNLDSHCWSYCVTTVWTQNKGNLPEAFCRPHILKIVWRLQVSQWCHQIQDLDSQWKCNFYWTLYGNVWNTVYPCYFSPCMPFNATQTFLWHVSLSLLAYLFPFKWHSRNWTNCLLSKLTPAQRRKHPRL